MMRSKLFVPGSRPELFVKALGSLADGISIDLEDAVLESRKAQARDEVRGFLEGPARNSSGKLIIVRVNDMNTAHFADDLEAVVSPALYAVNLPKLETADEVAHAAQAMERLERKKGIPVGQIGVLANIESPRGLRHAAEIALSSPRIVGLQIGFGDLFEPLSIDRADLQARHHVQLAVRLAAGEAGVPAYDGAFPDVADQDGYCVEAEQARRLGYAGKSCIHPSQVALANSVFRPNDEDLRFAGKVLEAWEEAERLGRGAITIEGKMIDKPFVARARAMLAAAGNESPSSTTNIEKEQRQ